MEAPAPKDQRKQIRLSLFINVCMAVYAIATFARAVTTHEVWRIVFSTIGSAFFVGMVIILLLRLRKLRLAA